MEKTRKIPICGKYLATLPFIIFRIEERRGGEYVSAADRRQRLLEVLCLRRQDTYDNLAREFNVSKRTIQYDIAALTCSYPIETVSGRYGGVKVASWYHLGYRRSVEDALTPRQAELLKRLRGQLTGEDRNTMDSILYKFAS